MTDDIYETPSSTPNFQTELAEQLAELVPEVVADGKIDILKLQELLAVDTAESSERFGLSWPGKQAAMRAAQRPTTATLKPAKDESHNWEKTKNIVIEGDNLEVLKILQKHYHGQVKMVYIDPPYNTGRDFVYRDSFADGIESYLTWSRQMAESGGRLSSNSESEGRFHSNWLNMIYPRLKLARNLLTQDGVIFISIDDNEQSRLHMVCDEIFGSSNYVATISREAIRGGSVSKHIRTVHDYVLVYAKNIEWFVSGGLEKEAEELDLIDDQGPYRKGRELNKWGAGSRRQDAPGMFYPIPGPNGEEVYPIRNDGTEGRWRLGKEKLLKKVSSDDVIYELRQDGTYIVYEKIRDAGPRTKQFTTLFTGSYQNSRGAERLKSLFSGTRSHFDYAKPTDLLVDLILLANVQSDDIVLDFFAGSGTTGDAVMQLNALDGLDRNFILVQIPESLPEEALARSEGFQNIAQVTCKRLLLAAEKIEMDSSSALSHGDREPANGFRVYKLAPSNFSKWNLTSDTSVEHLEDLLIGLRENAIDTAEQFDLLSELLIKLGYSLSEDAKDVNVQGFKFHSVGGGALLAYVDEHVKPTIEVLREALLLEPAKIIILEDALAGDDELKTNLTQLCRSKGIEVWSA